MYLCLYVGMCECMYIHICFYVAAVGVVVIVAVAVECHKSFVYFFVIVINCGGSSECARGIYGEMYAQCQWNFRLI